MGEPELNGAYYFRSSYRRGHRAQLLPAMPLQIGGVENTSRWHGGHLRTSNDLGEA